MSGHNETRPYYVCHEVTPSCPVSATTLGYYPNKGINIFFSIGFAIAALGVLVTGVWKRTWSYMAFILAGCVLELAGYIARTELHSNPWNQHAFETQICAIILGPTLICISIYLTLKHLCLSLNPAISRFRPRLYPLIFVPADVSCLLVQAIGGALAASGGSRNRKLVDSGNRAIIAGIALQVVVLLFFGATSAEYFVRARRWIRSPEATPQARALWADRKFRWFVGAVTGAYSTILVRCIYRIAEMAGGWGNEIMQDEPSFVVLDGFMIWIAVMLLAFFSPGFLFPDMAEREAVRFSRRRRRAARAEKAAGSASRDTELAQPASASEQDSKEVVEGGR
ncbi:Sphingoid long-chain base transporter RSB1 [Pleurostoma richardsiae]|uniref:Sphingoid long-chain base transporter RSB1 n=1 Tax=Pleurostoma richardsiae TaxID=41990 RepID=A0AA38RPY5_9PEZI|nr:Sphingoid long-chain base transporter RSB1 [Pleurostoma richardsiae]